MVFVPSSGVVDIAERRLLYPTPLPSTTPFYPEPLPRDPTARAPA